MTLFVISYLAGVLTILSPCILPILPFVFSRADQPFISGALPMLAGYLRGDPWFDTGWGVPARVAQGIRR